MKQSPTPPSVTIVGDQVEHLILVAPSTVTVDAPFRIQVQAKDRWGNPATYTGTVTLQAQDVNLAQAQLEFGANDGGIRWLDGCIVSAPGIHTLEATDAQLGLSVTSNPIHCFAQEPTYHLDRGDFHGGQIANSTKIDDFFRYARDVAAIDFTSYQRNDHAVSAVDWQRQQAAEQKYDEPGRFLPIPGFEWSPRTPSGGHHNVFFRRHNQPIRRSSHSAVTDKSDIDTDLPHVLDFYRAYRGKDVVITPHVGGEETNLSYHEPELEPAIEVTSTHGSFEWFLLEALERGYKVGFLGGSDSHTGRPGDDRPGYQYRRFAKSGLAGVYAPDLSLASILEALQARRCYATTGARILAHVTADGHLIGEEYRTKGRPVLRVNVTGTAPLESVEIFRGLTCIHRHALDLPVAQKSVRILWEGASRKTCYTAVQWDGRLHVSHGGIQGVRTLRFDSPRCRVYDVTADALRWNALTCGIRSGLVVDLEGGDEVALHLALDTALSTFPDFGGHGDAPPHKISYADAETMATTLRLRELAQGPQSFPLGILNRKVTVSLAPDVAAADDATHATQFDFVDASPTPGINPYWIRVVQTDMEMAWTSPIFVDYIAPPR